MKKYLKEHLILILALVALIIATPLLVETFWVGLVVLWAVWVATLVLTLVRDKRASAQ